MENITLDFSSLKVIEIPFDLPPGASPDYPAGASFLLREASEEAARVYSNALSESARLGPDGKPIQFKGLADIESLLVSMCVYEVKDGKTHKDPVGLNKVRKFPHKVVEKLYATAKKISEMDAADGVEALKRQRDEIDRQIASAESAAAGADPAKNGQTPTTTA